MYVRTSGIAVVALIVGWVPGAATYAAPVPVGSVFTYQGQLKQGGNPVNTSADFQFRLFDAESNGNQIGAMWPVDNVTVVEGQFTVDIDFGTLAFNGEARWIDISVRSPAGSGPFTLLSPRQPLRPVPMAQFSMGGSGNFAGDFSGTFIGSGASLTNVSAASISGVLPSSVLSGTYSGALNFTNAANTFTGNGSALSALNATNVSSGTLDTSRLSGALLSRVPAAVFLGNTHISSFDPGGSPAGVATSTPVGTVLFVSRTGGLQVIDATDLTAPVLSGFLPGVAGGLVANGSTVYVNTGSQLRIVNASTPSSPTLVGSAATMGFELANPAYANNFVYVATDFPTMQIFDVSNPASPTLAGSLTSDGVVGVAVAVSDGFAYLLEACCGPTVQYRVINVSNPAAPVIVATIPGSSSVFYNDSIAAGGGYLYIANPGTDTLDVYDVSTPSAPALMTSLPTTVDPRRVILTPGFLYVLRTDHVIMVFDVSVPSSPVLVGSGSPGPNSTGGFAVTRGHSISSHTSPSLIEIHRLTGVRFTQPVQAFAGVSFEDGTRQNTAFTPTYSGTLTFNNAGNTFAGSGAGLTSLSAANISTGTLHAGRLPVSGSWSLSSELNVDSNTFVIDPLTNKIGVGTATPTQSITTTGDLRVDGWIGTPLNQPVTLHSFTGNVWRAGFAASTHGDTANIIGGASTNSVSAGAGGATIGGGGGSSPGSQNVVTDEFGTIGGGSSNRAGDGVGTVLDAKFATVGGGFSNIAASYGATIGGGDVNTATGMQATIAGGGGNSAGGLASAVPGGKFNAADGEYSFAAGFRAKALHDGAFVWGDDTGADFTSTGSNQFLVRASGGVGIGTNAPVNSHRITIRGEPSVNPVAGIAYFSGGNPGVYMGYPSNSDSNNFELWNANNGYVRFGTNAAERVRITSTGRVGIGTTAPVAALHVVTTESGGIGVRGRCDNATGYAGYFEGVSGSRNYFERMTGIGRVPQINMLEVQGNASKDTAGSWIANSDRRIKTDVRELDDALSVIDRVRPVAFRYTPEYLAAHPSIEDVEYYNVIAQEFAEVFPDSVKDSGEKLANGQSILQVDVHPMFIQTVAAVQQLHAIVREKENEITALKSRHDCQAKMIDDLLRRIEALESQSKP